MTTTWDTAVQVVASQNGLAEGFVFTEQLAFAVGAGFGRGARLVSAEHRNAHGSILTWTPAPNGRPRSRTLAELD